MDYNELRKVVVNCVEGKGDNKYFKLNISRLTKKVKPLGLIPLVYKNEFKSKEVVPEDIPLLSEYFKGEKLQWFSGERTFVTIIMVREEDMDEELQGYLQDILQFKQNEENPNYLPCNVKPIETDEDKCKVCEKRKIDINEVLISIMSKYPCYTTLVAKWVKEKTISMNIRFRANSILIESDKENL